MTPQATNAQRTATLISAIKMLEETDFTRRMGSGILIKLTDLEGKNLLKGSLADEFCLAAEDMETVKPAVIASLKTTLERRKALLRTEIGDIDKALKLEPTGP